MTKWLDCVEESYFQYLAVECSFTTPAAVFLWSLIKAEYLKKIKIKGWWAMAVGITYKIQLDEQHLLLSFFFFTCFHSIQNAAAKIFNLALPLSTHILNSSISSSLSKHFTCPLLVAPGPSSPLPALCSLPAPLSWLFSLSSESTEYFSPFMLCHSVGLEKSSDYFRPNSVPLVPSNFFFF